MSGPRCRVGGIGPTRFASPGKGTRSAGARGFDLGDAILARAYSTDRGCAACRRFAGAALLRGALVGAAGLALALVGGPAVAAEQDASDPSVGDVTLRLAQADGTSGGESRLQRVLRTGSLEDVLAHAEELIAAGRYERAAGLLHALVIRAPQNADVKILLAEIYNRLGVPEQAQIYLENARQVPGLTAEQRSRIAAVAAGTRARQRPDEERAFAFKARVTAGVRYRTNATGGTGNDTVLVGGQRVATPEAAEEDGDFDLFASGFGQLGYVLAPDVAFDGRGFVFGRKQASENQNDVMALRLEPGIAFNLGENAGVSYRLRPYALGSIATAQEELALVTGGLGATLRERIGKEWLLSQTVEVARYDFNTTDGRGTADQQDAHQGSIDLRARHDFGGGLTGSGRYEVSRRSAEVDFNGRIRHRFGVGLEQDYPTTVLDTDRPSSVRVDVEYTTTVYDAPNPSISATTTRDDDEWEIDLTHTLPIGERIDFDARVGYGRRDSSLVNYERDGAEISLSLSTRF